MLALALAAVIQTTTAANLLTICDGDKLTRACALYLSGFVDSMYAQDYAITRAKGEHSYVSFTACLPAKLDLIEVRGLVLAGLKRADPKTPPHSVVMTAILDAYPCR